jgi:hypothetical protein
VSIRFATIEELEEALSPHLFERLPLSGRQRSWLENASSITEGVVDARPLHFPTSTSALTPPWPIWRF